MKQRRRLIHVRTQTTSRSNPSPANTKGLEAASATSPATTLTHATIHANVVAVAVHRTRVNRFFPPSSSVAVRSEIECHQSPNRYTSQGCHSSLKLPRQ